MTNLWSSNTPARFWLCQPAVPESQWEAAIQEAIPVLGLSVQPDDVETLLALVLGEAQFGPSHWRLGSAKRLYYAVKPILPRRLTRVLRHLYSRPAPARFQLGWPVEARYTRFQREVMRQLLIARRQHCMSFQYFWPERRQFAFVLTHDVERADGQAHVRAVADLEERFDLRSSFNFVPEGYSLDHGLMRELRERGFEVGVHGLKHDGKLFVSHAEFVRRAERINEYLKAFGAVGFRSPLTHRQPEWMQALDIEYDLSFFDTDPFEPMPGGAMSVFPFHVGRFVELPYTLVQDYTLSVVLGETTPRLWLQKVDFIKAHHGMVLVNSHPDYLADPVTWNVYADFLQAITEQGDYWHALPRDVAHWWRVRSQPDATPRSVRGKVQQGPDDVVIGLE